MKIKHKKQLEVLWMEGSRRDPRKTFEKKQKKQISRGLVDGGSSQESLRMFFFEFVLFWFRVDFILWTMKEESCEDGQVLRTNWSH